MRRQLSLGVLFVLLLSTLAAACAQPVERRCAFVVVASEDTASIARTELKRAISGLKPQNPFSLYLPAGDSTLTLGRLEPVVPKAQRSESPDAK